MPEFHITRRLHEEHMAVIALMDKLAAFLAHPPEDAEVVAKFLRTLAEAIKGEVGPHFDLEEKGLFDLVREYGDGDLADLLTEDHDVIRPLGQKLVDLIPEVTAEGVGGGAWTRFKPLAAEFADRLSDHANKEEMSLVPLLDELLEPDIDDQLSLEHA